MATLVVNGAVSKAVEPAETFVQDFSSSRTAKIDALFKSSSMHLERLKTLADLEWKMAAIYWAAMLTSGGSLIALSSDLSLSALKIVTHSDWIIILAYYTSAMTFLFGFSSNLHRSLVTERNRYQILQDRAMRLVGEHNVRLINPDNYGKPSLPQRIWKTKKGTIPTFDPVSRSDVLISSVWGVKVFTTMMLISGIWIISQIVSHEKINVLTKKVFPTSCAFVECDYIIKGGISYEGHPIEIGTMIAVGFSTLFFVCAVRAFRGSI